MTEAAARSANADAATEHDGVAIHPDIQEGPTLQDVVVRGRDAMGRVRRGSKEALTAWLDVAEALYDLRRIKTPEGDYLYNGDRYLEIAMQIGIHNRTDAMDLPRMHEHREVIFARCFADEAAATARGAAYTY